MAECMRCGGKATRINQLVRVSVFDPDDGSGDAVEWDICM